MVDAAAMEVADADRGAALVAATAWVAVGGRDARTVAVAALLGALGGRSAEEEEAVKEVEDEEEVVVEVEEAVKEVEEAEDGAEEEVDSEPDGWLSRYLAARFTAVDMISVVELAAIVDRTASCSTSVAEAMIPPLRRALHAPLFALTLRGGAAACAGVR
jgi:hypothetical protein